MELLIRSRATAGASPGKNGGGSRRSVQARLAIDLLLRPQADTSPDFVFYPNPDPRPIPPNRDAPDATAQLQTTGPKWPCGTKENDQNPGSAPFHPPKSKNRGVIH